MADIYGLDETGRAWRQKVATLAADILAAHAADVDSNARFPAEGMRALAEGGFYGLCIDSAFAGQGQGPAAFAAVVEELARHCGRLSHRCPRSTASDFWSLRFSFPHDAKGALRLQGQDVAAA